MSSKRIFITGASGYIGTVLTEIALAQGYKVHGLARTAAGEEKVRALGAVPVQGDLSSLGVLAREAAAADIVLHLASPLTADPTMDIEVVKKLDFAAVDAMAGAMKGSNKPLVVASGALGTLPDPAGGETDEESPLDPNATVDRPVLYNHALEWAREGVAVSVLRLAPWVYGRGSSGLAVLMQMTAAGGWNPLPLVDGGAARTSVIHVDDAARLFLLAAEKSAPGEIYNGVGETTVSFAQMIGAVGEILGVGTVELPHEVAVQHLGPFFAGFLREPCRASSAKAKRVLGWEPREAGVLEDIRSGSYLAVAEALKKSRQA